MSSKREKTAPGKTGLLLTGGSFRLVSAGLPAAGAEGEGVQSLPCDGVLPEQLLSLHHAGKLGGRVTIGVETTLEYYLSKPRSEDAGVSEAERVQQQLEAQFDGGVVATELPHGLPKKRFAAVLALPRTQAREAFDALEAVPGTQASVVSTTHALLGYAAEQTKAPRRWTNYVRVIPGSPQGLTLLVCRGKLAGRNLATTPNALARDPLYRSVSAMVMHGRDKLDQRKIDGVLLHAEGEEGAEALAVELEESLSIPVQLAAPIELDAETQTRALLHAAEHATRRSDLSEILHRESEETVRLPVGAAALLVAAAGGACWWLYEAAVEAERELQSLQAEVADIAATYTLEEDTMLEPLEDLRAEVGIAQNFIAKRVFWGDYLRALPGLVPEAMTLEGISALDEPLLELPEEDEDGNLSYPQVTADMRFLSISLSVPVEGDTTSPPEVQQLSTALNLSPVISSQFPGVHGANVTLQSDETSSLARVVILCTPQRE